MQPQLWHALSQTLKELLISRIVEQFMLENHLECFNVRNGPHTFHGSRGSSNIDATLSSRVISDMVKTGQSLIMLSSQITDHL